MRLDEHELTAALTGAAKSVLGAQRRKVSRGRSVDEAWEALSRLERYQLLDGLGGQILPVLVALPDVEVGPGARPAYPDREVSQVVESLLDESTGRLKRAVLVKTRTALVQAALACVPPRLDPGALPGDEA